MWLQGTGAALRAGGAHFHVIESFNGVGVRVGGVGGVGVRVWYAGRVCTGAKQGREYSPILPCNLLPVWCDYTGVGARHGHSFGACRGLCVMVGLRYCLGLR